MKSSTTLIGIIFIILGILAITYQSITYTKQENVAKIGDVKITADTQNTVYFPPVLGGLSIVAGIVLVFIGRK